MGQGTALGVDLVQCGVDGIRFSDSGSEEAAVFVAAAVTVDSGAELVGIVVHSDLVEIDLGP